MAVILLWHLNFWLASEIDVIHRFHVGVLLLWSVLRLSFVDKVLMHGEQIVAIANCMLIWHFAGLCSSSRVLLIKHIFKLSHTLSLLDSEFLAFLVPTPLVDLGLGQSGLLGDHEQSFLGPVRVLFKFSDQLVQLIGSFSFTFTDKSFHLSSLLIKHISSALIGKTGIQWLLIEWLICCKAHTLSNALVMSFYHFAWISGNLFINGMLINGLFLIFTFARNNLGLHWSNCRSQWRAWFRRFVASGRITNLLLPNPVFVAGFLLFSYLVKLMWK